MAAGCVSALPRRARFNAMVQIARLLGPACRHANLGRWHRAQLNSSETDTALFALCELLDRRRTLYDPQFEVIGKDALEAALARRRGVVLLTVHGLLSNLLIRYFVADRGLAPTMVAVSDQTSFVAGAGRRPDVLVPSPSFLVQLRSRLRERKVVFAMVDRSPDDRRGLTFSTPRGPVTITDSMLRLAVRLDAPVLFTTCHAHGGKVVLRIEEVASRSGKLDDLTNALVVAMTADRSRVAGARGRW